MFQTNFFIHESAVHMSNNNFFSLSFAPCCQLEQNASSISFNLSFLEWCISILVGLYQYIYVLEAAAVVSVTSFVIFGEENFFCFWGIPIIGIKYQTTSLITCSQVQTSWPTAYMCTLTAGLFFFFFFYNYNADNCVIL